MTRKPKPVLLCILDGFGHREERENNAIALASTPTVDLFDECYPRTLLRTSGMAVGLPEGQMGNSEVGHTNLGAGRVVYQDLVRINRAIEDGSFFRNEVLKAAVRQAKTNGRALHLLGLLSPGGVHSHQSHLEALVRMAEREGVARIHVHAFLDGRDTPPQSALGYMEAFCEFLRREAPHARVATVSGRFYAMDRDKRWERVMRAYDALVHSQGFSARDGLDAIRQAYARGETDEFVQPTVCRQPDGEAVGRIEDGDAVIFFNFRADRARELTQLLAFDEAPPEAERGPRPKIGFYATMTEYKAEFGLPIAFPPFQPDKILPEVVAEAGLAQFRCAETEKYAHVTFFFNGGRELVYPREDRVLVPSPREVKTYDEKPEMSAYQVTDQILAAIDSGKYQLVVCNFANPDMVGHTGKLEPTIRAIEVVDECLGKLYRAAQAKRMAMIVTADHGNAEMMVDPQTGEPHTAHTTLPVPFWLVDDDFRGAKLREGILADVAPTVLEVMGFSKPEQMTALGLL